MGSFSVIIPIYLGAIFVFFIYIVAKIILRKLDDKEEEEVVDVDKEGYKDDGWWVRITERINKVGECVKEGRDLEPEEEVEEVEQETGSQQEDEEQEEVAGSEAEFTVLKNRLDRTEKSLDNLGK